MFFSNILTSSKQNSFAERPQNIDFKSQVGARIETNVSSWACTSLIAWNIFDDKFHLSNVSYLIRIPIHLENVYVDFHKVKKIPFCA